MEQPYKPNIVCVLADLSGIRKENRSQIYGSLYKDSQSLMDASSRGEIKGLLSIKRILSTSLLENMLSDEPEFLKQIKQYSNQDTIYILTHWEAPEAKEIFYQSDLHNELSEHGISLTNQGVRLIILQYINNKLSEPVIIER